ncbi:Uncharacterized protein APZ42_027575 [Daphnia magna]|uniref:Uncharacterized protein n=1 Tax=Daphnia magna TaxID=35525 RepID=A0A164R909_9CRUS|nr:Uncharacterized protein APZ42_027575 [Daphnia magna]
MRRQREKNGLIALQDPTGFIILRQEISRWPRLKLGWRCCAQLEFRATRWPARTAIHARRQTERELKGRDDYPATQPNDL